MQLAFRGGSSLTEGGGYCGNDWGLQAKGSFEGECGRPPHPSLHLSMPPDSLRPLRTSPVTPSTHLCILPDSECSGMTVFTYTYPCLRTRSGLSGLAPEPELLRGGSFYTHLLILPDSSGFSGLAPEAGIVTLSQFLHALTDFYELVPFGVLKF